MRFYRPRGAPNWPPAIRPPWGAWPDTRPRNEALRPRTRRGARRTCVWRITDFVRISNSPHKGAMQSRFALLEVRVAHRDYLRVEPRVPELLLIEWPSGESEPTRYWLSTVPRPVEL